MCGDDWRELEARALLGRSTHLHTDQKQTQDHEVDAWMRSASVDQPCRASTRMDFIKHTRLHVVENELGFTSTLVTSFVTSFRNLHPRTGALQKEVESRGKNASLMLTEGR